MRVSELMSSEPQIVPRSATLEDAGARMVRLQLRHLPVVGDDGALVGMITDHLVFRHGGFLDGDRGWMAYEPEYDDLVAGDIAIPVEVTATEDEELAPVLRRLTSTKQDALVVVDANRHPVGVLTEHDVLRVALGVLDPELMAEHEGSRPVHSVDRDAPASEALDAMTRLGIRHMVVTEDDQVVGVLSYGDLVADDALRRPELTAMDVVRSLQVRSRPPGTSLLEVATLMKEDAIGCVPIIDGLGLARCIVTRRDVLEAAIAGSETDDLFQ
jgi:CBS domain-containing protein